MVRSAPRPENLRIDVFKARSFNGGLSFGPNQRVTTVSSFPAVGYDPLINPTYMGDYIDIKAATTSRGGDSTSCYRGATFGEWL
jgi:hypothetical protein